MTKERQYVIAGNFGGYYDDNGNFVVCDEFDLNDADTDKYAIDVMNGDGYYNFEGGFVRYSYDD